VVVYNLVVVPIWVVVEVIMDLNLLQEHKWVVELEDANILAAVVVVERAKQALVDANALVSVPEDANVLPVLAAQVKDFAVLKDAAVVVVGARFYII
jgi:predicted nucleotidyltransferase